MVKLISAVTLTLMLTACGSEANDENKSIKSESKVEKAVETTKKSPTETVSNKQEPKKEEAKTSNSKSEDANKTEVTSTPTASSKIKKDIFALTTLDGKTLHVDELEEGVIFQEHKGKIVFLLFFGYHCPPCIAEIPALKALTDEKHEDMEIIAMEVQGLPKADLTAFKKDKGINYTLLSSFDGTNSKFIQYIGQRAQWGGSIPFLVVLNQKGEVAMVHVGGIGYTQFKNIYTQLSAKGK